MSVKLDLKQGLMAPMSVYVRSHPPGTGIILRDQTLINVSDNFQIMILIFNIFGLNDLDLCELDFNSFLRYSHTIEKLKLVKIFSN